LFERPVSHAEKAGDHERAVLIHLNLAGKIDSEELAEFRELALSAGATPVAEITSARRTPDAKYLIGSGKAEEVRLNAIWKNCYSVVY
jgi:GTP-binding protein HflX